jgi:ABC-2 type transport system permease protein
MPIFDQGYQHWSGTLSGHAWRWYTVARHGVRVGMKNVFLRLLIVFSWLPAAGLATILCLWGLVEQKSALVAGLKPILTMMFSLPPELLEQPKIIRVAVWTLCFDKFLSIELYISMIVVLLVGPALISQDLRFNALPLYFSRPLRRIDYFMGKLGVVAWFLSMVIIIPALIAYVLGLLFSLDITILKDTFPLLLACLAYGAVIVLSAGTLILALSSLSRNSRYIALFWVALWFVSSIVGLILNGVDSDQRRRASWQKYQAAHQIRHQAPQRPQQPMDEDEREAFRQRQLRVEPELQKMMDELEAEELAAAQTNWRWLPSYTANLSRIGDQLLQYNEAWVEIAKQRPAAERQRFLLGQQGPQFPWYWSAGVLFFLFGLSVCILNFRIRSLDRLK